MTMILRRIGWVGVLAGATLIAGCQASMGPQGGLPTASAPAGMSVSPAPRSASGTAPASTAGLRSYKVYNTTEQICERNCRSEGQCVTHSFSPLSTINGYVAGQCQLYSRS